MMLHDDTELFEQVIVRTSEEFIIELPIVEKDYFESLIAPESSKKKADPEKFMAYRNI